MLLLQVEEGPQVDKGEDQQGGDDHQGEQQVAPPPWMMQAPQCADVAGQRGKGQRTEREGYPGWYRGCHPNPGEDEREQNVLGGAPDGGKEEPEGQGPLGAYGKR